MNSINNAELLLSYWLSEAQRLKDEEDEAWSAVTAAHGTANELTTLLQLRVVARQHAIARRELKRRRALAPPPSPGGEAILLIMDDHE